jgi:hypothetical protein
MHAISLRIHGLVCIHGLGGVGGVGGGAEGSETREQVS